MKNVMLCLALAACGSRDEARPAPSSAAPIDATVFTGDAAPTPDCDAYFAMMAKYLACDKLPAETRDAEQRAFDQIRGAMTNPSARAVTNDACRQAMGSKDALERSVRALGCTL